MHCCKRLDEFINREDYPIDYDKILREYFIRLGNGIIQCMEYCPWCGQKFPKDLRDEWFDTLRDMGFDEPREACEEDPNFPEAFKSDAWWKKRGL